MMSCIEVWPEFGPKSNTYVLFDPGFPPSVTVKQQYRLLGNSLNVHVVSELLRCLFQVPVCNVNSSDH